jgi:hypothetical protein
MNTRSPYYKVMAFSANGDFINEWSHSSAIQGVTVDALGDAYFMARDGVYKLAASCTVPPPPPICNGERNNTFLDSVTGRLGDSSLLAAATDETGNNFWITSQGSNKALKYGSDGTFLQEINVGATAQMTPAYIAVDSAGNVWVDSYNQVKIVKYNSGGGFLLTIPYGLGDNEVYLPYDMAVDSQDNLYVVENHNYGGNQTRHVKVFDSNGAFVRKFGTFGSGPGQFTEPSTIAIDSADNVYVGDRNQTLIHKFTATGSHLSTINVSPLNGPSGLAMDRDDNLYVGGIDSTGNGEVQKYDSSGSLLYIFDSEPPAPHQASGIAVSYDGTVIMFGSSQNNPSSFGLWGCKPPGPDLSDCARACYDAMGIEPDYSPMVEAIEGYCSRDALVYPTGAQNEKMGADTGLCVPADTTVDSNVIGENDSENALFLGNGVLVENNVLKTEEIWVGGINNTVVGNVNHAVSINVAPAGYLRVNGHVNDLQSLTIGDGGEFIVGKNADIWVDLDSTGAFTVYGHLDCNGLSAPPTSVGTVSAGTDNCPYISAGVARNFEMQTWMYALGALIFGFGGALVYTERFCVNCRRKRKLGA